MKINGLLMDDKDNVVTCVTDIAAGSQILYQKQGESCALTAQENIPDCHKAALVDLPCGAKVIKYGEVIGETLCLIPKGHLVNHENLISILRDYTGCSDVAANTEMSQKILTGFACNPNVYGVVIIGLGCETVPHRKLREKIQTQTSKPVVSFGIQEEGGTLKTIEKAVRAARDMAAEAAMQQKELCDISELLLGIECGGSDATSGIASNPAVGELSDRLVDFGASTMMSESIEWIGGEHVLAKRAATPEIHDRIIQVCKDYEEHLKAAGQDCRAGQPTPGNKAGGLSTLDEKSLGCIRKGGTRPIVEVLEQAQRPQKQGAIVMDTAGYDISSVTSMVAGGCNAVIFTTGRGTPTGNAIVPVLKVTANAHTYQWMEDNMDVDLSPIITGEKTYQQMGEELVSVILDVCNGKLTKAEAFGFSDIAVDHVCRFV